MLTKEEIFEQDVASKLAVGDSVSTAVILDAMAKYAKEVAVSFAIYYNKGVDDKMEVRYKYFKKTLK